MNPPRDFVPGTVYFAGSGPGDPELLTCKARRLIETADLILYAGSLVNPAVLDGARPEAVRMDTAHMRLEEQVAAMVPAARAGRIVARLHTGDPSIFGAIAEQIRALTAAGVAYEIIPGVSSAFAAAAALGIEYTLPERTQTLILTRLAGRTPMPLTESMRALAAHHSSLVIFLSTGMLDALVADLRAAGYAPETPVAVVYRASWPDQKIVRGTLATIGPLVAREEMTHQALIVISPALQEIPASPSHLYAGFQQPATVRQGTAIIALTATAAETGRRLADRLADATLYIPERFRQESDAGRPSIRPFFESIRQVLQSAFFEHQALVCVMAAGIVVRELAPLLANKHSDPAVVVVDAHGHFAVSLLSGHEGGANLLALKIASLLQGQAVITTASDVLGFPALDVVARAQGWRLDPASDLPAVMAALVNGEPVGLLRDARLAWPKELAAIPWVEVESAEAARARGLKHAMVLTARAPDEAVWNGISTVIYHPPVLVAGIGCNRGTPAAEIDAALDTTLSGGGLARASIACLATIVDKANEPGLVDVAAQNGWALQLVTHDQVQALGELPTPSPHAQQALGVAGVAEPAAMIVAGTDHLLVAKRKFPNVTVAIAQREASQ